MIRPYFNIYVIINYSSSFSKTLFGRIFWLIPKVIQKGTINPKRNNNIQKAIPPINKNNTIPKMLMSSCFVVVKVILKLNFKLEMKFFLLKNLDF